MLVLDPLIRELAIKRIGEAQNLNSKDLLARLPELRSLATIARKEAVTSDPKVVESVGGKLAEAGTGEAWNVALEFLNYKSFLNSASLHLLPGPDPGVITVYQAPNLSRYGNPTFAVSGRVPKDKAALFELNGVDLNTGPEANQYIFIKNGAIQLDGTTLKSVVFEGVDIFYSGGPLSMENVYFFNCTFHVLRADNATRLAVAILQPTALVNFKST